MSTLTRCAEVQKSDVSACANSFFQSDINCLKSISMPLYDNRFVICDVCTHALSLWQIISMLCTYNYYVNILIAIKRSVPNKEKPVLFYKQFKYRGFTQ